MSSWRAGAWRIGSWRVGAWRTTAGGTAYGYLEGAYATASAGVLTPDLAVLLIGAGATASQGSAPYPGLEVGLHGAAVTALFGRIRFPDSDAPPADLSLWVRTAPVEVTAVLRDGEVLAATPEQAQALRTYVLDLAVTERSAEIAQREPPRDLYVVHGETVWQALTVVPALYVASARVELFAVSEELPTTAEESPPNLLAA